MLFIDGTKSEANAHKFTFAWKKAVLNVQFKLFLKISKELELLNEELNETLEIKSVYDSLDLVRSVGLLLSKIDELGIPFNYGKGARKQPYQRLYENLLAYQLKCRDYEIKFSICGQRNRYSKTDPDVTFMHGKEDDYNKTGLFKPYYNIQIGVSDEYILHFGVYSNPTDTKTFIPFMNESIQHYQDVPQKPVADAGYGSYDNYCYCLNNGMKLMMKYSHYSQEKKKKLLKKSSTLKM